MNEQSSERKLGSDQLLWAISFQDMLSLILAFFILIFSMSEIKKPKPEHEFLQSSFPQESPGSPLPKNGLGPFHLQPPPALNLDYLTNILESKISGVAYFKNALITPYNDRVILSLPSELVFETAKANLTKQAQIAIQLLAEALRLIPNRIQIYGYTDSRPVRGGPYVSNWELSLARALSVEQAFLQGGYDKFLITQGFSDTPLDFLRILKKKAAADNDFMRRVDIAIFQTGVQ